MNRQEFWELHHRRVYNMWRHPNCTKSGTVLDYRLTAETIIGRYLKPTEIIHHHYNKDSSVTLVICENRFYHGLLETRTEALRYCGNANLRKCIYCKQYDYLKNLSIHQQIYHIKCLNEKYLKIIKARRNLNRSRYIFSIFGLMHLLLALNSV